MFETNKDKFWLRRLHTLGLAGNGATIVVLASFIPKTDGSLEFLYDNNHYFTPFIIGLFLAGIGAGLGEILENIESHKTHHEKLARESSENNGTNNSDDNSIETHTKSSALVRGNSFAARVYYELMRAALIASLIAFCTGLYSLIYISPK